MQFCSVGFYLSRLIRFRLVSDHYAESRRDAFLTYPTIPLAVLEVLPLTTQQTTARMAVNLAREPVEERAYAEIPTLPMNKPYADPARTEKIVRVWRRTNGGKPQEVVTFSR